MTTNPSIAMLLSWIWLITKLSIRSPLSAEAISFSNNATLSTCPSVLKAPTKLLNFTGGKVLIAPTLNEGDLCILTRVNRNATKKVYIPLARSYDGNDWHRIRGGYISHVSMECGEASVAGLDYEAGEYLCEIDVPYLTDGNVGYFLTKWEEGVASDRRAAARFLERATWGATWDEIINLEKEVASYGKKALATWVQTQQSLTPSSHRVFFRERLNPRTVESYQYGIPGPKACMKNARFRRFAFTYKDLELSRGNSGYWAGNTGLPFTPVEIQTLTLGGVNYYSIGFGGEIRTILNNPLQYEERGSNVILTDGNYTICHVEEVVGNQIGNYTFVESVQFQLLVGDLCTSSYTNRGGVEDGKGDGATSSENIKVGNTLVRLYDKNACDAKCGDATKVKLIKGGNPAVTLPSAFDLSALSWVDLSALNSSEIVNINEERSHDSSWLLQKDLDVCTNQNGDTFPDPARLANTDYFSYGHGKYNLDKPIFALLPGNKWALHDFRTQFQSNTPDNPMEDGGGATMKSASRSGPNDDGNPDTDLVVRCSNVQRNIFNEVTCRISYHKDACTSVPLPDPNDLYRSNMHNPGDRVEELWKYLPSYAGPDHGGVIVCGSENEVPPVPTKDDHFDVTNRKVEPGPIDYEGQKTTVWIEVVMSAKDQLCQRLAFGLSKIFATSTTMNADSFNSETNIGVYDNFVTLCFSTYKDVMKKVSFNQEMSEQLTFKHSKSVGDAWYRTRTQIAYPDENYARENLQLHSIGLLKLNEDGTEVLDSFGKPVSTYEQKHIFSAAKVWTSFKESFRRGNYEDLDYTINSYLDPLQLNDVSERDWFPKITADGGYLGDGFPLCEDLPERHFLKKGATFRLLGGSSIALSHNDPMSWEGDDEIHRMKIEPDSQLYNKLCNPLANPSLPSSTLTIGTGVAEYNAELSAPFCQGSSSSCDSGSLLVGRVTEANSPNTIDGCVDGEDTRTIYTESIKRILVSSLSGEKLRGGDSVKIQATVISFAKLDRVDLYYASDATNPVWRYIATISPLEGESTLAAPNSQFPDISYTLPKCLSTSGCKQAVRVVLRSSRNPNQPSKSSPRNSDGLHKPDSSCGTSRFDDTDDLVFDVLPSPRPKDLCSFETLVKLESNLPCYGRECVLSTLRVIEVVQGVFYEYLPPPCIYLPFYNGGVKVFAGAGNNIYMCANKLISSARATCCGTYPDRGTYTQQPDWADVLNEYRGERLSFAENESRCTYWGLSACDAERIGPFTGTTGQCQHHQSCLDVQSSDTILTNNAYHWTTGNCITRVKINPDGLIAIIHKPEDKWKQLGSQAFPQVQSHVNENTTVSYFHVQWDMTNVGVGKLEYPHVSDNACDGGRISGKYCICDTALTFSAVFNSLPSRDAVLSRLFIGAFDVTMYNTGTYTVVVEATTQDGVSVYKRSSMDDYSSHTIFRVKDVHKDAYIFLRNLHSTVSVCNGAFFFRNSPTFYDIVDPQLTSAYHEVDAYLDYVDKHSNTPPFVCLALTKHFGYSNPSPQHVQSCSDAYKSGVFTWINRNNSSETMTLGSGSRGDLKAVSASILLASDSLSPTLDSDPYFGGLKEPLHKLMQIMRGLGFTRSKSHRRTERLLNKIAQDVLGQTPYGIPNQFAFFSPDYSPPGAHVESSLVSPEAELLNMKYAIATQNGYYALIQNGLNQCWGGLGAYVSKGIIQSCGDGFEATGYLSFSPQDETSSNVISQLSTLLTADRLDYASKSLIESVYAASFASGGKGAALKAAEVLMASTPAFHANNMVEPLNKERTPNSPSQKDESQPYKAVIYLNLFGGMDSMNLLVPHPDDCPALYEEYKNARGPNLYLPVEDLLKIDASSSNQPCTSFGVNKHLGQDFVDLYTAEEVLFIANIGHLQKHVTAANFLAETKTQLFSHHTLEQESFKVDAFQDRGSTGILGRMTDVLGTRMSTSRIAIDGSSNNLISDPTIGLKVDVIAARGPDEFYVNDTFSLRQVINKLNNSTAEGSSSIHAELFSQSLIDSTDQSDSYVSMLNTVSDISSIDTSTKLGKQFNMILRLIKLNADRGINRDTFAVTMDGFDTHFDLKNVLHQKLAEIGAALKSFRDELVSLGLWNNVTVVVASEMGRTITPNTSEGTDHGWGGHHFILGGQLNGSKILGHHPDTYDPSWMYNTGRGAWIPTTSNEGMWFGIAQWFGIGSNNDLDYVLPNMNNFGCRLYSEIDLYKGSAGKVPGCGGDIMSFSQTMLVSDPRTLSPDEQKVFCSVVYDSITNMSIKCVIIEQILSVRDTDHPQCNATNLGYALSVWYEISSDKIGATSAISGIVNSDLFKVSVVSSFDREVCIEDANIVTAPTQSPSLSPSMQPSTQSSSFPSSSRSDLPSSSPSATPSVFPSASLSMPSHTPSNYHSIKPTFLPSESPSFTPSSMPSDHPSQSPIASPSSSPLSMNPTISPSAMLTKQPTKSPSTTPSIKFSATTIEIKSSFDWNLTCSLQSDEELLVDATIVEQSLYETISPQLEQNQTLDYVLVIEMCQRVIAAHNGTTKIAPRRHLQTTDLSKVQFIMEATQRCESCGDVADTANRLFLDVSSTLESELNSGNLTSVIQSKSQGTIDAFVHPESTNSSFTIKTSNPTASPSTPSPTPKPSSQSINSKIPTSKPSKQPSNKSSASPTVTVSSKSSKASSKGSTKSGKKTKKAKKIDSVKKKRVPLSVSEVVMPQNTSTIEFIFDFGPTLSPTEPSVASYDTYDSIDHTADDVYRKKYRAPTPSSGQSKGALTDTH